MLKTENQKALLGSSREFNVTFGLKMDASLLIFPSGQPFLIGKAQLLSPPASSPTWRPVTKRKMS